MYPSKTMRNIGLFSTSTISYKVGFGGTGICITVFGISGLDFSIIFFGIIFILIGFVFVPLVVNKMILGGEEKYPISPNRLTKNELLADISSIDDKYAATINDDWIDVTWNWKNTKYFNGQGISKEQSIFMKLYRIKNNGTYDELDCEMSYEAYLELLQMRGGMHYHCFVGRTAHKIIEIVIGKDKNAPEKGVGVQKFELNTLDITNYMHKWFADRGYRENK